MAASVMTVGASSARRRSKSIPSRGPPNTAAATPPVGSGHSHGLWLLVAAAHQWADMLGRCLNAPDGEVVAAVAHVAQVHERDIRPGEHAMTVIRELRARPDVS